MKAPLVGAIIVVIAVILLIVVFLHPNISNNAAPTSISQITAIP